ncbi:MlaD family protein [Antrihabitans spumae]|uniref:MlaD family protein n=1 Tax=Antrihabitans spumae TaxID=3373370 RepID=A0ABW7K4G6_9NOCA
MKSVLKSAVKLSVFALVMVLCLVVIISAIKRPVSGDTESHLALFTDANGLKSGDDVRMYGVQVGKVESVSLEDNLANVRLVVQDSHAIYENSELAIRYQTLTGQRYLDIQQPPMPTERIEDGATIGTDRTIPSFDVTSLFNGLKPVLANLSPDDLNRFAESLVAVIEGDGNGIGPALDAIGTLSSHVKDRQAVIATLVRNLSEIQNQIGGRSPQLVVLLAKIADVFEVLQQKIDGLVVFALTAPEVLTPLDNLLDTLGLTRSSNPDIDNIVAKLFPNPGEAVEVLSRLPGLLDSLNAAIPQNVSGVELTCSRGNADLPPVVSVLLSGQRISICN